MGHALVVVATTEGAADAPIAFTTFGLMVREVFLVSAGGVLR
jgi:hypothetical protein